MDVYKSIVTAAERALEQLLSENENNIRGNDLLKWVLDNPDLFDFDVEVLKNSWGAYLTRAISDPETKIAREPGKYSLILKDKQQELPPEESDATDTCDVDPEKKERQKREDVLYQLLSEWFISRNYNAEVTANIRKGRTWENPDIVGLMLLDDPFGNQQIEIGTIEAKISLANWRKEFFEAVAHKRFSNRAYFAFAVGANEPSIEAIPYYEEIRKYGEKYNVGILVVFMNEDYYKQLTESEVSSLRLTLDDVIVSEVWPAIYDFISTSEMYSFIKNVLQLDTTTKVNNFGK